MPRRRASKAQPRSGGRQRDGERPGDLPPPPPSAVPLPRFAGRIAAAPLARPHSSPVQGGENRRRRWRGQTNASETSGYAMTAHHPASRPKRYRRGAHRHAPRFGAQACQRRGHLYRRHAGAGGTLHGCLGLSTVAHGELTKVDLDAVRAAPGVVAVLTHEDVPGVNDISPTGRHDEPVLAEGKVHFWGQPIFCVIAETREQARRACKLAKVEYAELPAIVDIVGLTPRRTGWSRPISPCSAATHRRQSRPRRAASPGRCALAARTISTWRARFPWPSPVRITTSPSIVRRSTPARCNTWSATRWACPATQ